MNDLADLLLAARGFIERYVVLRSDHQAVALPLYIAHTYVPEAADATPYVAVTSPEKRSGKTRLLEVLELLVHNPLLVAHLSEAALYRTIAAQRPTLLFDEVDTLFGKHSAQQNEGLRRVLNAGYRRNASVHRCEGEGKKMRVVKFDVFCPKVLAGIGRLPDTLSDRAIHIRLHRKARDESVDRFRPRIVEPDAADLRGAFQDWAGDVHDHLREALPDLPPQLDDRAQDSWEPLLAIADLAGREWPQDARAAAIALADTTVDDEETLGVLLLEHVRETFNGHDRLATADLLKALVERDDGPWAEWWGRDVEDDRTKGPASRLSRLLKPFEIAPKKLRDGASTMRGYNRDDLEPVWSRYLSPHPPEKTEHGTQQVGATRDVPSSVFSKGEGEGP